MKFTNTRSSLALSVSAVAMVAALTMVAPAFAADTATLQGHAAAGSTVTATDTVTGQSVTATAKADGTYIIVGLRPSTYHVTSGSASDDVTLAVGETTNLDLGAPAESQVVTVTGRRSKEVRTSEISTSVSQRQIENLPQNDRNFMNFAALAPGVSVSQSATQKQFQGGGVGPDQVGVFVDGQSFKNFAGHGGVSGQAFSRGNPFPQLAIQEFKVSSQNFKAEIEQAGSAVISAVTKTGGTEFHGTAFFEVQTKDMIGRPYFDRPGNANNPTGANQKPDYNREQYGVDIGGPIIKNTLHFYLAYEGTKQKNPTTAVSIPSNATSGFTGSFADPFKQDLIFGKLTWFANDADKVDFSIFKRDETDVRDYGGNRARESARDIRSTSEQYTVEWTHRGDGWLNEMSLSSRDDATGTPQLTKTGPQITLTNGVNGGELAIIGRHFFAQDSTQKLVTFKNDLTLTDLEWKGRHTVKMGVKLASTELTRTEDVHTQGSYWVNVASTPYTTLAAAAAAGNVWKGQVALSPSGEVKTDNTMFGVYLQDDWAVDDHLTLNLGIRWDYETNMMNNKYVTPANIVSALAAYTNWTAAGIDYHDYVSTGSNRKSFTGAFQPRLGFSYDVNGDRDLVFYGGVGRYYDRNAFLSASLESIINTRQTPTRLATLTVAETDPAFLRTELSSIYTGGDVWLLNNKTRVPYTDQMNIGVRKRFGDIQTSAAIAHNKSYDAFQYVRGNRLPNGTFSPLGDGYVIDNFPTSGQLPGYQGKLNIGANGGKAKYTALFFTVDKPFNNRDRYGFSAALTLADAKNTGSEHGSDEFFAGARQDVFGYSYTLGVDKLRFVGTGIVAGPWDTTISGTLTLASGAPFGSIDATGPNPPNACCIANLSGVYFPEDKLAYQNLDLRIAKDFELPNGQIITADAQVYNVFDHVNRAYSAWGAGANWGGGAPLKENSTTGNARTFQVGLKYKW